MKIVQVYLFTYLSTYLSIAGLAFLFVSPGRPADAVRAQDSVQPSSAKNFRLVLANHCGPRRHVSILAGLKIAKFEAWAVPRSFIGFSFVWPHPALQRGVATETRWCLPGVQPSGREKLREVYVPNDSSEQLRKLASSSACCLALRDELQFSGPVQLSAPAQLAVAFCTLLRAKRVLGSTPETDLLN